VFSILTALVDRLDSSAISGADVIPWGCPVLSFGDAAKSRVATLGLNPSNREFMDVDGQELEGEERRFPTLRSLRIPRWTEANAQHLSAVIKAYGTYFRMNPYDGWFKKLDLIVTGTRTSYYDSANSACHLDLIPYATSKKWTELTKQQRATLLTVSGDALGLLLRDSPIEVLILNGRTVIEHFQVLAGVQLDCEEVPSWSLPRRNGPAVAGVSYSGFASCIGGIPLGRSIRVLGYNHNIQSSYGVTTATIHAIRSWVAQMSGEYQR
jgi:hypothetical protein